MDINYPIPGRTDRAKTSSKELRFAEWRAKLLACLDAEFTAGREQSSSSRKLGPLKWTTVLVARTLVNIFMDRESKTCFPSLEELATAAGVGYSTAKAATRRLQELGWLTKIRRGEMVNGRYRGTSNFYKIRIPRRWTRYFSRTAKLQRTTLQRYLRGRVLVQTTHWSAEWHEAVFQIAQRETLRTPLKPPEQSPPPEPAPIPEGTPEAILRAGELWLSTWVNSTDPAEQALLLRTAERYLSSRNDATPDPQCP